MKVPGYWDVQPLDKVTDFQEGPGILAKDFHDSGVPLLRLRNIETPTVQIAGCNFLDADKVAAKWKHFALREGDLLISTSASLGRVSVVGPEAVGSIAYTGIIRFRSASSQLNHQYLRAFLSSGVFVEQAERMATGSVIKHFGPSHLRQMAITLPSLNEQIHIAGVFDALDDRITLLRETNATLEAIAQALFKSWFVDFDPVRAKMEGRAPEGMDEATAALFPDALEESELGWVPEGWRVGRLDDLLVLQRGFDLPSQDRIPGEVPIIAASGPSGMHHETMVQGPGVVTGRSGVLGRVFLEFGPYWPLNTTLWIKEFRAATPCFAYELLRLLDFKSFNAGSAVPTLNRNHIHGLAYLVPNRACVEAFEGVASMLHQRVKANEQQAQTLATLRDTLLPRLISGQLRLPEAQALAAEV
ncbi:MULTISPECIES: restriction endonuclease subunit S [unclassified Simplicispira]|uniref:restriction endonuclease subunit S n=1 Tax=unclassified Simplicispira TaxID=2630407 RepID=UPI001313FA3A|nr:MULTISPECIES: restriction endonuclease subunit S [unclassified Simplicispira]